MGRRSAVPISIVLLFLIVLSGCVTNEHIIGQGPQGSGVVSAQQWYALWGLVPLNEVNTRMMAEGSEDYKITTEYDVVDVLINIVTQYVTITTRTVTVTK